MTEDERATLNAMSKRLEVSGRKTDELYEALLELPPGSLETDRPLLQDIRKVVQAYKRMSWAARATIWVLSFIGVVGGAVGTLMGWFSFKDGP